MSTKTNGVPSYMTPHACTQDPPFFSHKLLSKNFEIKPQLMMAAATGLPSVGYKTWCACRQSVCIGCSTTREVTNPLITKKPTDYRPSEPGPTYLEDYSFLITCTTCFTRLLTSFRRYIQRLVSMSIADGLASTNLLLLYNRWQCMPWALWDQRVTPQLAWTTNSLWLLKYEAVITSNQSVAHLLKPSLGAFVT